MDLGQTPNFDRILKAIAHQEADRLPLEEPHVDLEVKQAFLGRPILTLQDEIDFWRQAGYDFVIIDTDLNADPHIQAPILDPHANTAETYTDHRLERNWVSTHAGLLRTLADVDNFPLPTSAQCDFSVYDRLPALLPSGMKAIVTTGHAFTSAWQLMGMEQFCISLLEDLPLVQTIIDRLAEESLKIIEQVLTYDTVGAVWWSDDIAYTNGMMVSPRLLRVIFFPWLKRAADLCHAHGRPLLFHTDGVVTPVIEDVIAAGVDVLHPIEPKCMDIVAIKRQYGDRLALMGNLDLGYTLTRGTPDEVRTEVLRLIREVAPGGGFALGSANSVPNYVPLENYLAMLETTLEYGAYPIRV